MSSDMGSNTTTYPSHHHHHLFFNKKTLREIDIPPRKLLGRRSSVAVATSPDHAFLMDSPKGGGGGENEGLLQKFLPYNNLEDDDDVDADVDPYCSDHFRMYEFKVRKCTRSRSHDWTDCPFAHPGEKARRRDPRRFHYTGTVCAEFRRGSCSRGDNCEFAHGVFECWLHPSRYRTEACKDGKNCKRKVCFFAHTPRQLRVLPASFNNNNNNNSHDGATSASSSPATSFEKNVKQQRNAAANHCCVYCAATATAAAASPTSTLIGMSQYLSPPMSPSHSMSPPLSPVKAHTGSYKSGGDHLHHRRNNFGFIPEFNSYKDALTQLMSSLEAMELNQSLSPHSSSTSSAAMNGGNLRWVDVNFINNTGTDDDYQHQQQFILSPSTPIHQASTKLIFSNNNNINNHATFDQENYKDSGISGPDLGWVNDLLT